MLRSKNLTLLVLLAASIASTHVAAGATDRLLVAPKEGFATIELRHPDWPDAVFDVRIPEHIVTRKGLVPQNVKWEKISDTRYRFSWHAPRELKQQEKVDFGGEVFIGRDMLSFQFVIRNPTSAAWASERYNGFDVVAGKNPQFHDPDGMRTFVRIGDRFVSVHEALQGKFSPNRTGWMLLAKDPSEPQAREYSERLMAKTSLDGKWVLAIASDNAAGVTFNLNPATSCIHQNRTWQPLQPGEMRTMRGKVYLLRGTLDDLWQRYAVDKKKWSARAVQVPIRQITHGPKFHWFGYYDKLEFDPTCRYVLGMEVDFEHRSPTPEDVIKIGMVDLEEGDKWIELGESRAWCWQQGCMLQWRPGSKSEILWNDRQGDRFVCHILDVFSRKRRTIPHPVYSVSPCGKWSVTLDFRRVQEMRPGYGYPGLPDPNRDVLAPEDSGIFRIDLETGASKLIVPLAAMQQCPVSGVELEKAKDLSQNRAGSPPRPKNEAVRRGSRIGSKNYFNHLLISPDGSRFEFLHRWGFPEWRGATRMLTAKGDGTDIRVVDPYGRTSHFIWRDPHHILAWAWHPSHGNAFYLFEDKTGGEVEIVGEGVMVSNGHCTYLSGNQWILNDTYPQGENREQSPYLYHVETGKRVWLGHFRSPAGYDGEWRCDTHPRFSPDGRSVVIDSAHSGQGRQLHLIDITGVRIP